MAISPAAKVTTVPYVADEESADEKEESENISSTREPAMLGMASIREKWHDCSRGIPSILDAVIQMPRRLTPGNIAII